MHITIRTHMGILLTNKCQLDIYIFIIFHAVFALLDTFVEMKFNLD